MDIREDLNALVEATASRDDFVAFVGALRRDLAANPERWENRTLDDFPRGSVRLGRKQPGLLREPWTANAWRNPRLSIAAKFYEQRSALPHNGFLSSALRGGPHGNRC